MTTADQPASASLARRVLVVEHDPTRAEQFRQVLQASGYAVTLAADSRQALAAAREDPPMAVICGVVVPGMDGYALCRRIKSDDALRDTPVILVTGLSDPHEILDALECGADGIVRNPTGESLLSRLRDLEANRARRTSEPTPRGEELDVAGRQHVVGAGRRQLLDLLISTYQEAVDLNAEVAARQREVDRSSQLLRGLYRLAKGLNEATNEQAVADAALDQAMALPGVEAGWISLRDGETGFRVAAARRLPAALAAPGALEGDCLCRRALRSGDAGLTINVRECERLQRAHGDTRGLRHHASIPLWVGDRVLGVMNLAGPEAGLFRDEDLPILNGVGNQVAIALERARLLDRLEDEVRRRTAALAAAVGGRREAEETGERLTAILETTSDFVAIAYPDGRLAYCNRAARRLLGREEGEAIEHLRVSDTHPDWANRIVREEGIPTAVRDGTWSGETALLGRDGHEIPVSQVIIAHRAPDGSVAYLSTIARDLTERKRAEATQRQTEKLAVMGELLAGVAHELNNPLAVVLGRAALLEQTLTDEGFRGQAQKLAEAATRCARIVRNFLALARHQPMERRRTALNQVVEEAVELLAYPLRIDGVQVRRALDSGLPLIWADPHQLQQVVVNLVTNAHQAMRKAPSPRHLALTTRQDAGQGRVVFEVADTGPGIPPDIQARIFEPFFTTKPPGEGTGLGLSLCHGIVERHGGAIHVRSAPGEGATFVVELPVDLRPGSPVRPEPEGTAAIRPARILVVDDELDVASMLADFLRLDGHEVHLAGNGRVALQRLRSGGCDLIFTDVRMPELDGPGLYRALAHERPGLLGRIVFLTGDALSAEVITFLEETRVPRVHKPFTLEEVRRVIARTLRG